MTEADVAAIRAALKAELDEAKFDPYRTAIFFLVGLLAFCLSVIVGIFAIVPDYAQWKGGALAPMIGGVLAWIALAALIATVCGAVLQVMKRNYFKDIRDGTPKPPFSGWAVNLAMALPIIPGAVAVSYCVRGGAQMLATAGLPSFYAALLALL